jgi:phosphatidylserine/phosphatidylglycerophosphate/cardiolipin synthase-like enzyme
VIKKEKKKMKFRNLSILKTTLWVLLFSVQTLFSLWLPPLFFEDSSSPKKQGDEPLVAQVDLGKTHFIVGGDRSPAVPPSSPAVPTAPHIIDGIPLNCDGHICTVLFDNFYDMLETLIARERKSILVAAYMLTDKRISDWLCEAHNRGVRVEVVTDLGCLRERSNKLGNLYECNIPVFIYMPEKKGIKSSLMHNKFILFESNIYKKKIVWTGSANLTRSAFDEVHHENVVILDDDGLYQEYQKKFAQLKKRSERYEDCTITNAALHDKIRTSNNTKKNGQASKPTVRA